MDPIEKELKAILFRHLCPTQMELGDYVLDLLDPGRRQEIAFHIAECVHCPGDLVQIREFLTLQEPQPNELPETPSLVERARIFVVNLLSPPPEVLAPATLQPALRGEEGEMQTETYHFGPYLVALSLQKDPTQLDSFYLLGDVLPVDEDDWDFRDWQAHLFRSDVPVATVALDREGHFSFDDLLIADVPYELILSGPDTEIYLQNLQPPYTEAKDDVT
jgi:hypothetical protein